MIFTAQGHTHLVRKVELIGLMGRRDVTENTTQAYMPETPKRWGFGWADRFEIDEQRRIKAVDDRPVLHRHYGLIRWFK